MVTTVIYFLIVLWFSVYWLESVVSYHGLNTVSIYKEIDVELIETRTSGSKVFLCNLHITHLL